MNPPGDRLSFFSTEDSRSRQLDHQLQPPEEGHPVSLAARSEALVVGHTDAGLVSGHGMAETVGDGEGAVRRTPHRFDKLLGGR